MRYVALLRGINVGGKNRVPMSELRACFEAAGFREVSTYINSGNVIFSSTKMPIASEIEQKLTDHFGFNIDTLVLSGMKLTAVVRAIPDKWDNDTEQKSDVGFLFPDIDTPDILEQIGYRPDVESMLYVSGAILMNVTRNNQSKSSLLKLMGTLLYKRMTIRNVITTRKLAKLIGE